MEHLILEEQVVEQQGTRIQQRPVMTMEQKEEMQHREAQVQEEEQGTQEEIIVQVRLQLAQEEMEQEDY